MKKLITLLVIFGIFSGAINAQDSDYNIQSLDAQSTVKGKLGILQQANRDGTGTTEFYSYALDSLLMIYPTVTGNVETKAADDMAQILCAKLGEAGHTASGFNLWRVVENFTHPLVRAEALSALGKAQAKDFIPQVCLLLSDLNLEPGKNPAQREQVAFGAIVSLDEFKDTKGYLPVFFVTTAWYTDRVKKRAREALPKLMSNPSEPLISVIKSSEYDYFVKYTALQTLEAADVSTQEKSQAAVAALAETWKTNTNLVGQKSILGSTRKLALSMIRRYKTSDTTVYPFIDNCYKQGLDEEEKIAALQALSALGSDDAVKLLSGYLYDMNTRLDRGSNTKNDERLIRVIIPALGNTSNPAAQAPLKTILQKDWTNAVQKLAQDAIKKLQ